MKKSPLLLLFLFILATSCTVSPEAIKYNHDECAYCKMKISDARFGAEMVTAKGKVYKYDSAECLVRTFIENEKKDYAHILVTDYSTPHSLIDAASASFVISEKQPSPMGGNLSAYDSKDQALMTVSQKGGRMLFFEGLVNEYQKLY